MLDRSEMFRSAPEDVRRGALRNYLGLGFSSFVQPRCPNFGHYRTASALTNFPGDSATRAAYIGYTIQLKNVPGTLGPFST